MDERPWHRAYDLGVPAAIDYERLTLPEILARTVERVPDDTALVFSKCRLTWRELAGDVARCSGALARLGVGHGSTVAIHLPNLPQAVISYFAALALGARVVLTNPLYTPREIEHQWNDAGCEVVITGDWLFAKVAEVRERVPAREYLVASIAEYLPLPLRWVAPLALRRKKLSAHVPTEKHVRPFRDALRAEPARAPGRVAADFEVVALLQYTGGTTGVSKAAMLTHANLSVNAQQCLAWFGKNLGPNEVVLNALPLFHVYGMTVGMNFGVLMGAKLVLLPNPRDIRALVSAVAEERVTLFPGVPTLYNAMNHYPDVEQMDVTSVKYCLSGSAPIAPEVLQRFERLTGARIIEGYGLTETSPLTHANPLIRERKVGTIGLPMPDTDVRIVALDDPGRTVGLGVEGELAVRGPQVMQGYWKRPEETEAALRGGWMHTGDLARVDEQGYFTIVGRKKEMINVSGLKVYPDEVDAVLLAHGTLLEAATIGLPDPRSGERVKSFVVRKPGITVDPAELQRHCRASLAPYKVPREIEVVPELPKSAALKILRRELRDRELAKLGQR